MTGIDPVRDFEYRGYTFEGTGALRRNDATISQMASLADRILEIRDGMIIKETEII